MPSQRQIRGAVEATQEARTLVSRELDINTSDDRLSVHDGSTVGGIPHVNYRDDQNQEFTYAAATGTDAIVIALAKAPAAYAAGQKFAFKAASTNTASATLNVNSLGAKTIKKKNVADGTISVLVAGDIIGGGIYSVYYDGTDMILESVDSGGGGLVLVDSASGSGIQTLTLGTGYSNFIIIIKHVVHNTTSGHLLFALRRASSSKTAKAHRTQKVDSSASAETSPSGVNTTICDAPAGGTNKYFMGTIDIVGANESMFTHFEANISARGSTTFHTATTIGHVDEQDVIEEVRFQLDSGSIDDCEIEVWGQPE